MDDPIMPSTDSHHAQEDLHVEEDVAFNHEEDSRKRARVAVETNTNASSGENDVTQASAASTQQAAIMPTEAARKPATSYEPEYVDKLFREKFPVGAWYESAEALYRAVSEWASRHYFTIRKEGQRSLCCSRASNTNYKKKEAKEKTSTIKQFAVACGCTVELRFSLKKVDNGRVQITFVNGLHNHPLDVSHITTSLRLTGRDIEGRLSSSKRNYSSSKRSATSKRSLESDSSATIVSLPTLRITILGGGNVGSTLAHKLVKSNKFASVEIAARNPAKTTAAIQQNGINDVPVVASTPESLSQSHVVILATPGIYDDDEMESFASSLGDMKDKIIIDATNPLGAFTDGLQVRTWEGGISSGEKLQSHLPKSKVYKSFNTVGVEHMREALGKDMMIAGDEDVSYRGVVEAVVAAVGFKPFYVGPIRYSRNLEAMAEMWIHMAIPGLGGRSASRNFWFSVSGDP